MLLVGATVHVCVLACLRAAVNAAFSSTFCVEAFDVLCKYVNTTVVFFCKACGECHSSSSNAAMRQNDNVRDTNNNSYKTKRCNFGFGARLLKYYFVRSTSGTQQSKM